MRWTVLFKRKKLCKKEFKYPTGHSRELQTDETLKKFDSSKSNK